MRVTLLIFFLFNLIIAKGQMIDNSVGAAFTDENFFNSSFIKKNKIKSLSGSVATKREGEPVIERDQFFLYEFDEKGRLTSIMTTFASYGHAKDTTIILFYYDSRNNLITKRRSDNFGFFSYNFEYDSINRKTKETYCRDENIGEDRFHFKLGKQFEISSETFTYHQYIKNQKVKKYFNNYGKQYQETFSYFNELGYHTHDITRLTLSGKESKIIFEYDEKGHVSKKSDIAYIFSYNEITNTFTYDAVGNLEEHAIFHNNKQTTLRSLIYDKKTLLMTAQVMKDYETGLIYIFKYSYQFY